MPPVIHLFDPPERFVTGTVGPPGQRTFFLQARSSQRLVSVALEKEQVAALADRMEALLDQVMSDQSGAGIPSVAPTELLDSDPLEQPIEEEFRAGTMTLSWDPADARVVVEVFPRMDQEVLNLSATGDADAEPEPTELLLVRISSGTARAFIDRVSRVVGAGRPSCPFCGEPMEATGHLCVRANGFRRRDP